MTPTTHRHTLLQRSERVKLTACHTCEQTPYTLQTRQGIGSKFRIARFFSDRDAAMAAYTQERTKA